MDKDRGIAFFRGGDQKATDLRASMTPAASIEVVSHDSGGRNLPFTIVSFSGQVRISLATRIFNQIEPGIIKCDVHFRQPFRRKFNRKLVKTLGPSTFEFSQCHGFVSSVYSAFSGLRTPSSQAAQLLVAEKLVTAKQIVMQLF